MTALRGRSSHVYSVWRGSNLTAVTWAFARCALLGYLALSCIYTCGPRRSRAVVGPALRHIWSCQSIEHLAEMFKDPEMALAVTQDEPIPTRVTRPPGTAAAAGAPGPPPDRPSVANPAMPSCRQPHGHRPRSMPTRTAQSRTRHSRAGRRKQAGHRIRPRAARQSKGPAGNWASHGSRRSCAGRTSHICRHLSAAVQWLAVLAAVTGAH